MYPGICEFFLNCILQILEFIQILLDNSRYKNHFFPGDSLLQRGSSAVTCCCPDSSGKTANCNAGLPLKVGTLLKYYILSLKITIEIYEPCVL